MSPFFSPFIGTPGEGEEAFNTHRGQVCVPREHSHALQRVPAFLPFNYISALSVAGGKEERGVEEVDGMGAACTHSMWFQLPRQGAELKKPALQGGV